jgi:hypothetical protein
MEFYFWIGAVTGGLIVGAAWMFVEARKLHKNSLRILKGKRYDSR